MIRAVILAAAILPPLLVLGYGIAKARSSWKCEAIWSAYALGAVGAIVAVGEGKLSLEELKHCLQTGGRVAAVQTAPAQGLFLEKVFY